MSAYQRYRIATVVTTILTIVCGLALGEARFEFGDDTAAPPAFWALILIPLVVDIAVSVPLFVAASRRTKAELAAGYTTRSSGFAAYDQVDPRTGTVIRPAGSVVLAIPGDTPSSGDASAAHLLDSPRFTPDPRMRRRKIIAAVLIPIIAIIAFGGGWAQAGGGSDGGLVVLITFVFLVVIFAAVYLGVWGYMRSLVNSAESGSPDSFVFVSRRTPEFHAAAASLGLASPTSVTFAVALTNTGLDFWSRKSSGAATMTVPWSQVDHVQPARLMVASGNNSVAAATLHDFVTIDDHQVDLPVPVYGRRALGFANVNDANRVLDEVAQHARIA
jgi:hypothetical protein